MLRPGASLLADVSEPDFLATAPTIDTARLTLRGHRTGDLAECASMWADPVVVRHIGGVPIAAEKVWIKLLAYLGHWSALGFGYWVVCDRSSGRFVGEVGLADFRRDLEPSLGGAPEIGWALASWAHGRGLATEAVTAVVAWGDTHLAAPRTVCMIDPDHLASIRVAEKCGYLRLAETTYHGAPIRLFARSRP